MTRKEQNKILNDKIEANNAQYNLDRMNAEISAYSSGNLSKYEYLTNKDLGYKPDAFEKAKFEYSPLGKAFTDGLNKTNKKEGLLKRLKKIESKSNNQLLALKNINKPAIRGRHNDNDNEEVKEQLNKTTDAIKIYKKKLKMFENIPNIESKMNKNEKFTKMLEKVLNEIITNKIYKKSSTKKKLLILHGLMIQNYLIKLTMMLLVDTVETKI